ncbi:hypothetical protein Tco_0742416 [Tanacetum coccineum]
MIKSSCLWKRFTKAIYGEDGALNSPSSLSKRSPRLDIIREVTVLRTKGINILDLIRKKVGKGLNTLFWEDLWLDDLALKHKFLRLYALDNYKQITIVEKNNDASMVDTFHRPPRGGAEEEQPIFLLSRMDGLILTNVINRWVSSLEATSKFSVKSIRNHFKTLSLDELRSPGFDLFSNQGDYSEEEVAKTMAETMEQYMSKTRADYGSGVARPKIEDKDHFELKGQFLKEL